MTNHDFRLAFLGLFLGLGGFIGELKTQATAGPTVDTVYYLVLGFVGIATLWFATRDKKNTDEDEEV